MPLLRLRRGATPADAVEAVLASEAARSLLHGDAAGTEAGTDPGTEAVEWIWLLPDDGGTCAGRARAAAPRRRERPVGRHRRLQAGRVG